MSQTLTLSSRYRSDIVTIFDVFCEVGCPQGDDKAYILTKYPDDFNDESVLRSVSQFSFPCGTKELDTEAVQLFSFVLTDANSKYTFGYCRYTPRSKTCLCILSGYPWPSVFYKMLNYISLGMNNSSTVDLDMILTRIYHSDVPSQPQQLTFDCGQGMQKLDVKIPDLTRLPTLREDKYMLEFYNAVSLKQMLAVYASLLKERRIIFTGRKLGQISSCIYAATTLLFPMTWQSLFIPVLPEQLVDMMMAPMPFLIGVPKQTLQKYEMKDLGDVVIVDIDEKTLQSAHDDIAVLPNEVSSFLKNTLRNSADMGDSISRCFLRANVMLFGKYRLGFVRSETTGDIIWDKNVFLRQQRSSYQAFLSSLLGSDGVQYLERFMEDKVAHLNTGMTDVDEFEREIQNNENSSRLLKDNSTDVIGALKDKVSGIQIGAKLNKLAPKPRDIRKARPFNIRRPQKTDNLEPLSFDNVQWNDDQSVSSASSREPSPKQADHNVPVGNLIDFDSPSPEASGSAQITDKSETTNSYTQLMLEFDPFATPSPNTTGNSVFYAQPVVPQSGPAIFKPTTNTTPNQWEKFE